MRAGGWSNYDRSVRFLMLALIALAPGLWAQESLAAEGFDHFYNLEFDEAIALYQRDIALHPDSAELHNHLAQSIVFREMLRDGALESELVSGNNSFLRRPKLNPTPETERWFLDEIGKAMALADAPKRLEGLKDVQKKMRVAKYLGAPVIRINLGGPGKGIADEVGVENCIDSFKRLLPLAKELNVKMTIENHGTATVAARISVRFIRIGVAAAAANRS